MYCIFCLRHSILSSTNIEIGTLTATIMSFLDPYDISAAGTSTPPPGQPEQSLNEEVTQVLGQLNRFWGGFRKQVLVLHSTIADLERHSVESDCHRDGKERFLTSRHPGAEGTEQVHQYGAKYCITE